MKKSKKGSLIKTISVIIIGITTLQGCGVDKITVVDPPSDLLMMTEEEIDAIPSSADSASGLSGWDVQYDPATMRPLELTASDSTQTVNDQDEALKFLVGYGEFFGINKEMNFRPVEENAGEGGKNYRFLQYAGDVPVPGFEMHVYADSYGYIISFGGRLLDVSEADLGNPALSAEDAISGMDKADRKKVKEAELVVYAEEGAQPCLAWRVLLGRKEDMNSEYVFLDANDGQEIKRIPTAIS